MNNPIHCSPILALYKSMPCPPSPPQKAESLIIIADPVNPEKGAFFGTCNRGACSNSPAIFYNYSTQRCYCQECAIIINDVNRADAFRLYGHDLCIEMIPGPDCIIDIDKPYPTKLPPAI